MLRVYLRRGWPFIMGVFLLFMLAGLFSAINDRKIAGRTIWFPSSWLSSSWNTGTEHPITTLMKDAKVAFTNRLAKQSKTLPEAVAEYKRRYGRDPPRGFDHWWEFAKERDFMLVDEFDAIDEDLAPFWTLSGEELRRRTYLLGHLPSITLVRIQDGNVSEVPIKQAYVDKERGHRSRGFRELLEKFIEKLPNMDLAINSKAESRVLVPWEHLQFPSLTLRDPSDGAKMLDDFTPTWRDNRGVWEAYRRTCPPGSPARQLYSSYRDPTVRKMNALVGNPRSSGDLSAFVESVDDDYDFCANPWAHYTQGHFFSDWQTIPVLSPLFSPSKAKGFADIRIPSHYYLGSSARYTYGYDLVTRGVKEIDDMEVPWDQKRDLIFWRGATTGGGSTPPGFTPTYQRHRYCSSLNLSLDSLSYTSLRFLRMAHESTTNNVTIVHASPSRPNTFISTTVPARDLNNDIMDVAFVSAVGEYPGGEEALRKAHRFTRSVPLGEHWSYKYLLDLDGMSYSARFMALLASDSAVLKSTVYKEYFSDWIQPWLHYIPLSSSYPEIYNIHAYFSGPSASTMAVANMTVEKTAKWETVQKERDTQLRQIARAGKQWKHTLGRTVDMEVYVYRLCLEYARLWADDRDAMRLVL
ncbi:glycosyltransferase family 90 protein [Boletus edulis BED1]|uniref:Glycosyltransferase family 90 protein n=1 Tax=Boletus edulis BED1 TaxID=1328754 RepID=A0AAD4GMK0_BOLED|nr:glycosyltransferase family 90 protein [Boletus edulis BED1]